MSLFLAEPGLVSCLLQKYVPTRYTTLCQWPERAHDLFRDALFSSPLVGAASRLMEDHAVRVMNTIVMGSSEETIIPRVPVILSHTPPLFKALIKTDRECEVRAEMAL